MPIGVGRPQMKAMSCVCAWFLLGMGIACPQGGAGQHEAGVGRSPGSVWGAELTAAALLWGALLLFVWHCHRVGSEVPAPVAEGQGPAPAQLATGGGPGPKLYGRLQAYAKRYSWAGMGRVHRALREAGARRPLQTNSGIQQPGLLFLPELPSSPYFPRDAQRHDIEVLEGQYPAILAEFERAHRDVPAGWTVQQAPGGAGGGSWLTFHLYRRGVCQPANCRACPRTFRALAALRSFINSNSFGDACFSLLTPGTVLNSTYGLTNARLRCHLGLKIPVGCELVVGGEPQCWSEGYCLLVDDSFLNTTSHNGPPDSAPRVTFIVDLWHPHVAAAERQALDYIFTPGS